MVKKEIRFTDIDYNDIFTVADGGKIQIIYADGKKAIATCEYIDDYHFNLTMDDGGRANTYHIHQFAEICAERGNTVQPVAEFELVPITEDEVGLTYSEEENRGSIGHLRGDFDSTGKMFYTSFFDDEKRYKTDEFKKEFDTVVDYFRENPDLPLLKDRASMQKVMREHKGFEIESYVTTAAYKVRTDKHSYYFRCAPAVGNYDFYIHCYNNEQLDRYKDVKFTDKTYGNIEADKFFKTDDGFTEMFYNPDANAGGQVVINEISNALIKEAAQFKTADAFFEHINEGCRQSLIDAGTPAFRGTVKELVESKADLEGINKDTMKGLMKAAGIKPKSQDIAR